MKVISTQVLILIINEKDLQYQYSALSVSNKKLDEIQEENSSIKLPWHESETNQIELLDYLHDWNFPIFQLNEKTDNHILSKVQRNKKKRKKQRGLHHQIEIV